MHEYRDILGSQKHKRDKKKVVDETSYKKYYFTLYVIAAFFYEITSIYSYLF